MPTVDINLTTSFDLNTEQQMCAVIFEIQFTATRLKIMRFKNRPRQKKWIFIWHRPLEQTTNHYLYN